MHNLNYIIWNGSPDLFSIGPIILRWYGLLFALSFLITQQILYYIFRKEGKPERDVETLTIYMVVATILGARLGHIFFYQPEILIDDPLSVILPFKMNPFRFTGFEGLASHGAAIGILTGLYLYSRKKKPGQNYLQTLDRIVILVALAGAFIRFGNYFNSEILGKPSDGPTAIVFINRVTEALKGDPDDTNKIVNYVTVKKNEALPEQANGRVPIKIFIEFKPDVAEITANQFIHYQAKNILYRLDEFVDEPASKQIEFKTVMEPETKSIVAEIDTLGISRHPAQLYEAFSCIALFIFLFSLWWRYKKDLPEGRIFGYFMIILWSMRFAYEYLKENQVPFEDTLPLNMGQILSVPLVLVGIFILVRSYKKQEPVS